jgi:hypothetical protein
MTNDPKGCERCGKNICDNPIEGHGCSSYPVLSSGGIESVLCHGHPADKIKGEPEPDCSQCEGGGLVYALPHDPERPVVVDCPKCSIYKISGSAIPEAKGKGMGKGD